MQRNWSIKSVKSVIFQCTPIYSFVSQFRIDIGEKGALTKHGLHGLDGLNGSTLRAPRDVLTRNASLSRPHIPGPSASRWHSKTR